MKHLKRFSRLRQSHERGAAAVELALLLPVLLMIVFGIIDFGRLLNAQITVTEAAREGAHAYALGGDYNQRVRTVTQTLPGTVTATPGTACPASPGTSNDATVTVTYRFSFVTPVGALMGMFGVAPSGTKTLTATGVMPCLS